VKLYLTECKSCGRQVESDGSEGERCYFCKARIDGVTEKKVWKCEKCGVFETQNGHRYSVHVRYCGKPRKVKPGKQQPSSVHPNHPKYHQPERKLGEFGFLITETDLAKLDDEQFTQQWLLIGKMIRNRAT